MCLFSRCPPRNTCSSLLYVPIISVDFCADIWEGSSQCKWYSLLLRLRLPTTGALSVHSKLMELQHSLTLMQTSLSSTRVHSHKWSIFVVYRPSSWIFVHFQGLHVRDRYAFYLELSGALFLSVPSNSATFHKLIFSFRKLPFRISRKPLTFLKCLVATWASESWITWMFCRWEGHVHIGIVNFLSSTLLSSRLCKEFKKIHFVKHIQHT